MGMWEISAPIALDFLLVEAALGARIVGQALSEEVACLILSFEWQVFSTSGLVDMKEER